MQPKLKIGILIQYFLPQHLLSKIAGWIANCRWKWLKNIIINNFITKYNVNLNIAILESINDYPNFNSFFTRKLKPELRPIASEKEQIASPVDGCVSQVGSINKTNIFQAKNQSYDLKKLLANNTNLEKYFYDGKFATLYLAPKDYHRVHMPITGTLEETIYVPGDLFSVNKQTAENVSELFARNERLICIFKTDLGKVAIILVGAMLVSGIKTSWNLDLPTKNISHKKYEDNIKINKGEELGYFHMGSTVILLFPKNTNEWLDILKENKIIKMGSCISNTINKSC
ncbi:archaetidylserine decarboxylase [Gammaproteobacteria bacterium]|nr:archaetidylserine decarboxylase [Gammaproteobacteria bacterium]